MDSHDRYSDEPQEDDSDEESNTRNLVLSRLRGKTFPRKVATIDIETVDWVNPYAVGFYNGRTFKCFVTRSSDKCIDQSLRHVLRPRYSGYWIYAHNGGNYDFLFFLRKLLDKQWVESLGLKYKVEVIPIGSCIICFIVTLGEGRNKLKWTFVDSFRLMPVKLAQIGETFGLTKKIELSLSYNELAKAEHDQEMREYLRADCVCLYQAIQQLQSTTNRIGGNLGVTLPSTSMDLFRRAFQRDDIFNNRHFVTCKDYNKKQAKVRESQTSVNSVVPRPGLRGASGPPLQGILQECFSCGHDFIKEAYYGGRTEIFRMKYLSPNYHWTDYEYHKPKNLPPVDSAEHPIARLYDVNSMYPYCMLAKMPVGPATVLEGIDEEIVYKNATRMVGIVDCDVDIPTDCYLPPLPVKYNGKLVFPVGRFSGVWDISELSLLREIGGRIVKTRKSTWFASEYLFNGFVQTIYQYRDKNSSTYTRGMDFIAKLFLNSLYGKYAMEEERSKILIHPDSVAGLKELDSKADIWTKNIRLISQYVCPQLSVHVTALARRMLWKIMKDVIQNEGRIYYCDTDSVVCSGVELETSSELGGLKLEETITRAEFVLPKLYRLETESENKKKSIESRIKIRAKGMGPGIRVSNDKEDDNEREAQDNRSKLDGMLSDAEFTSLINGEAIHRNQIGKFRESIRGFEKGLEFPRVVATTKQLRTVYDKRHVLDDYDTVPITLNTW